MVVATFLINTCIQAGLLGYGIVLTEKHLLQPDVLLAFMLYQGQLQEYCSNLFNSITNLIKSTGAGQKVFEILDRQPERAPIFLSSADFQPCGTVSGEGAPGLPEEKSNRLEHNPEGGSGLPVVNLDSLDVPDIELSPEHLPAPSPLVLPAPLPRSRSGSKGANTIGEILSSPATDTLGGLRDSKLFPHGRGLVNGGGIGLSSGNMGGVVSTWQALPRISVAERGRIEFTDVHFAYPARPSAPVLRGISLVVRPGEVVALVGASGAGKSTIFHLLQNYYYPQRGRVEVDGLEACLWDHDALHRKMALVGQEPVLFSG